MNKSLLARTSILAGSFLLAAVKLDAATRLTNSPPVNGETVISWNSRGTLEMAAQLSGPWLAISNAPNPFTTQITDGAQFFRLNQTVDATTLHKKVLCGYQGWFRCPGDAANLGWVHWSSDLRRIAPQTLTFEMWPDMTEYRPNERFPAPGFAYPDAQPAELFSSDNPATVLRHFQWMRDYGLDGAWLQRFLVGLPGGPAQKYYPSSQRVMRHVSDAAEKSDRVWAISYDTAGMPAEQIFDVLTSDWKKMVDEKWTTDSRYLRQNGKPVVQIWGFYWNDTHNRMTAQLANKLIDFFNAPGPYSAFLVGGGSWDWRRVPDPDWQKFYRRFDAYAPWNVGNWTRGAKGEAHASMGWWAEDKKEIERNGRLWMPVVYPGFSWDNLQRKPAGTTLIPRRGGRFLWEQFHELSKLDVSCIYVAMFDEVDEGTAMYKLVPTAAQLPAQGTFVPLDIDGYNLGSDWYLRLADQAGKMLRGEIPVQSQIPITPP